MLESNKESVKLDAMKRIVEVRMIFIDSEEEALLVPTLAKTYQLGLLYIFTCA